MIYTLLYWRNKTPPTVNYAQGSAIAFMQHFGDGLTLAQGRFIMATALSKIQAEAGLGTPEEKAQWMKYIQKSDWSAYWVPFQDLGHKVKDGQATSSKQEKADIAKARTEFVSQSLVGEGCDIVVFYMHGGGFVQGHALQSLDLFRNVMREVQQDHGLAPEVPFPGGLDECLYAYRALIEEYGIDPKRIVFGGDSAGGNLCYSVALKLRDECAGQLPLPAAIYTSSPYFPWRDELPWSIIDTISPKKGDLFVECYTLHRPEVLASQYYTPFNAKSLAGLPPTLIIWGSIEVLATWIEKFVDQAKKDGVEVETMVKPDRSHCWFMIDPVSTVEDRQEGAATIAQFLAKVAAA
ncbi:hypothetical protein BGX33_001234 [Mortierella sp. NVP41]|nr:hypothetical protein BGX33_001234 [Mortierella sp. NVP41]